MIFLHAETLRTLTTAHLTIDLLDAPPVIIGQLKVVRLHPLVKWSHDGQRVVGVLQTQGVTQLVDRHQKEVVPCRGIWQYALYSTMSLLHKERHCPDLGTLAGFRFYRSLQEKSGFENPLKIRESHQSPTLLLHSQAKQRFMNMVTWIALWQQK